MFDPQDSNLKKFLKSPHHLWLLGLTLGVGFISANPLVLVAGSALYAVGWIYLPDMGVFQRWVGRHMDQIASAKSQQQIQAFRERRQTLMAGLSPARLRRYLDVAGVCQDIEKATVEGGAGAATDADPRLRKLDELMWTFLRLLVMEGSLESFLAAESEEQLPVDIQSSQAEIAAMEADIKTATGKGENPAARLRLLDSKKERLAVLSKRQDRVGEGRAGPVGGTNQAVARRCHRRPKRGHAHRPDRRDGGASDGDQQVVFRDGPVQGFGGGRHAADGRTARFFSRSRHRRSGGSDPAPDHQPASQGQPPETGQPQLGLEPNTEHGHQATPSSPPALGQGIRAPLEQRSLLGVPDLRQYLRHLRRPGRGRH
jgi:hypothetical protein